MFPHATKRWCKKIRGKLHYFGPWSDSDGALAKYLEQKDALHAGRPLRPDAQALQVKDIANAFLQVITAFLDSTESLTRLTEGYYEVFLQRPADTAGLNGWVDNLQKRASFLSIAQQFVSSDEFYNRAAQHG